MRVNMNKMKVTISGEKDYPGKPVTRKVKPIWIYWSKRE